MGDITCELPPHGGPAWPLSTVETAGALVHEAAHRIYPAHVPCGEGAPPDEEPRCDADAEGAYGVQAWWLYDWTRANQGWLQEDVCWDAWRALFNACFMILDTGGYSPCESWDSIDCEGS